MGFRFPGGDERCTIIGATGTGKSTCGVWMLSRVNWQARPWVAIDFKREVLFDEVDFPPIQRIDLQTVPKKPGLYLLEPRPGDEDALEDWLWKAWAKENIGLFIDEASLMPDKSAMRAILQQGRSKRIPVISCMQRPVGVARGFFSEASYFCVFRLQDVRDYRTIEGFVPGDLSVPLPKRHWYWYDVAHNELLKMRPVPPPETIIRDMKAAIPYTFSPFSWLSRGKQGR